MTLIQTLIKCVLANRFLIEVVVEKHVKLVLTSL